jgi:hypothetical protein
MGFSVVVTDLRSPCWQNRETSSVAGLILINASADRFWSFPASSDRQRGCVCVQSVLFVETPMETGFQIGQNFADALAALGLLAIVYRYVLK